MRRLEAVVVLAGLLAAGCTVDDFSPVSSSTRSIASQTAAAPPEGPDSGAGLPRAGQWGWRWARSCGRRTGEHAGRVLQLNNLRLRPQRDVRWSAQRTSR